jgi:hypothetical protein
MEFEGPTKKSVCKDWFRSWFETYPEVAPGSFQSTHTALTGILVQHTTLPHGSRFGWDELSQIPWEGRLGHETLAKHMRSSMDVIGPVGVLITQRVLEVTRLQGSYKRRVREGIEQAIGRPLTPDEWKKRQQRTHNALAEQAGLLLTDRLEEVDRGELVAEVLVDQAVEAAILLIIGKLAREFGAGDAVLRSPAEDYTASLGQAVRDLTDPSCGLTVKGLRKRAARDPARAKIWHAGGFRDEAARCAPQLGPFDAARLVRLAHTLLAPAPPRDESWLMLPVAADYLGHWDDVFGDVGFRDWVNKLMRAKVNQSRLPPDKTIEDVVQHAFGEILLDNVGRYLARMYIRETYPYLDDSGNAISNRAYWSRQLLKFNDYLRDDSTPARRPSRVVRRTRTGTMQESAQDIADLLPHVDDVIALRGSLSKDEADLATDLAARWLREDAPGHWLAAAKSGVSTAVLSASWITARCEADLSASGHYSRLAPCASRMAAAAVTAWRKLGQDPDLYVWDHQVERIQAQNESRRLDEIRQGERPWLRQ